MDNESIKKENTSFIAFIYQQYIYIYFSFSLIIDFTVCIILIIELLQVFDQ